MSHAPAREPHPFKNKIKLIEGEVARHLGALSRATQSEIPCKSCEFNAKEAHSVVDKSASRTLSMKDDDDLKLADVVNRQ